MEPLRVTVNPIAQPTSSGTLSPKYYSTISIYEYRRPRPFDNVIDKTLSTITLPLPTQLSDISASAFSNIDMGVVGDALNLFRGEGTDGNNFTDGLDMTKIDAIIKSALNTGVSGAYRAAVLAPEVVRNAITRILPAGTIKQNIASMIPAQQISTAIEQSFGAVPNPNPAVKFHGPILRDMNLSWYFSPKNEQESNDLSLVIQTLKNASLPSYDSRTGLSLSGILKYPKIVQLNFYPWDLHYNSSIPANRWGWTENSIIKMKRCFMSSVSVNYNPGTVPSFFADKKTSPVVTELSIQFKEIEYLTAESWGSATDMEDIEALGLGTDFYQADSTGQRRPRNAVGFESQDVSIFRGSSTLSGSVL
jgi:hypothetical protein